MAAPQARAEVGVLGEVAGHHGKKRCVVVSLADAARFYGSMEAAGARHPHGRCAAWGLEQHREDAKLQKGRPAEGIPSRAVARVPSRQAAPGAELVSVRGDPPMAHSAAFQRALQITDLRPNIFHVGIHLECPSKALQRRNGVE